MWYVYFLQSESGLHFYIGVTNTTRERLLHHNKGSTRSTKPYRPWNIIHTEAYDSKEKAYKREWYLKHPKGYLEKIRIIEEYKRKNV